MSSRSYILNQALLRKMMHQDPTASATHYELTELGDETRHMVMFGKAIERVGANPVRPRYYQRFIINLLPFAFQGPMLWVAALDSETSRRLDPHAAGESDADILANVGRRLARVPQGRLATVADAGHMLHHDQPAAVAAAIEPFLAAAGARGC